MAVTALFSKPVVTIPYMNSIPSRLLNEIRNGIFTRYLMLQVFKVPDTLFF